MVPVMPSKPGTVGRHMVGQLKNSSSPIKRVMGAPVRSHKMVPTMQSDARMMSASHVQRQG